MNESKREPRLVADSLSILIARAYMRPEGCKTCVCEIWRRLEVQQEVARARDNQGKLFVLCATSRTHMLPRAFREDGHFVVPRRMTGSSTDKDINGRAMHATGVERWLWRLQRLKSVDMM